MVALTVNPIFNVTAAFTQQLLCSRITVLVVNRMVYFFTHFLLSCAVQRRILRYVSITFFYINVFVSRSRDGVKTKFERCSHIVRCGDEIQ